MDRFDEIDKSIFEFEANKIKEKFIGAYLLGKPIDMNNPDVLIIAAYYIGLEEARKEYSKNLLELAEIEKRKFG